VEKATTIGLDIAKQVFQVHGADRTGREILRNELVRFFSELPPCLIGIEASGSAHFWARVLSGLGHTLRLVAPQSVKPHVKSQKNDANPAPPLHQHLQSPVAYRGFSRASRASFSRSDSSDRREL
jgi:hypothetical protein